MSVIAWIHTEFRVVSAVTLRSDYLFSLNSCCKTWQIIVWTSNTLNACDVQKQSERRDQEQSLLFLLNILYVVRNKIGTKEHRVTVSL